MQAAYDKQVAEFEPAPEFNASHILVDSEEQGEGAEGGDRRRRRFRRARQGELQRRLGRERRRARLVRARADGAGVRGGGAGAWRSARSPAPVQTQFGWHLIKLNDKRDTAPPPLDQVRPEIENELRQEALQAELEELRAGATDRAARGRRCRRRRSARPTCCRTETPWQGEAGDQVSPLAPAGGFPDLPPVAGVRFAAAEAGVRYRGPARRDAGRDRAGRVDRRGLHPLRDPLGAGALVPGAARGAAGRRRRRRRLRDPGQLRQLQRLHRRRRPRRGAGDGRRRRRGARRARGARLRRLDRRDRRAAAGRAHRRGARRAARRAGGRTARRGRRGRS